MGEKKIHNKNAEYIAVRHKDKIINLPVSLRFDEGELEAFLLYRCKEIRNKPVDGRQLKYNRFQTATHFHC